MPRLRPNWRLVSVLADHIAQAVLLALGLAGCAAVSAASAWKYWGQYKAAVYANVALAWVMWAIVSAPVDRWRGRVLRQLADKPSS